jgi:hypothetical protein
MSEEILNITNTKVRLEAFTLGEYSPQDYQSMSHYIQAKRLQEQGYKVRVIVLYVGNADADGVVVGLEVVQDTKPKTKRPQKMGRR